MEQQYLEDTVKEKTNAETMMLGEDLVESQDKEEEINMKIEIFQLNE